MTDSYSPTVVEMLSDVAKQWDLRSLQEEIDRLKSEQEVHIGFLGDFSSGKSTLINELTGVDDLLPVDLEPSTASAGHVMSIPDLEAREYFRVDPDGTMTKIGRPDFDDLTLGRTDGRPLVRLPSSQGFPAGFVFLDTPGLESFIAEHAEVTLGELPFVDVAVICVDIRGGGLSRDITTFLTSPGVRHLRHRFLIALTFADQRPTTERQEVSTNVAGTLSRTLGCSESEAGSRIVVVSAGPQATERDVSALRGAVEEVFERRRESLMAERQLRTAGRLVPQAISLLDHIRNGLLESDEDFASRKGEQDNEHTRLERKLDSERRRLAQAQTAVRQDVQAVCNRFRTRFAGASDDKTLQQISGNFSDKITSVVRTHLTEFGQDTVPHGMSFDEHIVRVVKDTTRIANVAATICTAVLSAVIIPGVGAAASAVEGAGGAAVRQAGKTAAGTVAKNPAGAGAGNAAGTARFATGARSVLMAVHELNPVNMVSDVLAEWWKNRQIEEPMDQIRAELSNRAASEIESYFEQEVFQPLERKREDVQRTLAQLQTDRRAELSDRRAKVGRVDADIERLRNASKEPECR